MDGKLLYAAGAVMEFVAIVWMLMLDFAVTSAKSFVAGNATGMRRCLPVFGVMNAGSTFVKNVKVHVNAS